MNTIWERITEIINNNKGKRGWHRAAGVMAAFIIFGVTYALILPAITLEDETAYDDPGMFFEEEDVAYEEPAYEEEYFEEPVYEEPVYEEAAYEEPAYEEDDAAWEWNEEYQEDAFDQAEEDGYANDGYSEEDNWAEENNEEDNYEETETEAPVYSEFVWEDEYEDEYGRKLTVKVTPDYEIYNWPAGVRLEVTRALENDKETKDLYEACLAEGKKQEKSDEELELSFFTAWKFAFVSDEGEYVLDDAATVEVEFREPVPADEDRSGRVLLYQWPGQNKETEDAKAEYDYTAYDEIEGFRFHTDSLLCDGVIFEVVWPEEDETEAATEEATEVVTEAAAEEETEEALFVEAITEEETEESLLEELESEEETEEVTETVQGPVFFEAKTDDVTVTVYAPAGTFPEGTTMEVKPVEAEEYAEAVEAAVVEAAEEDDVEVSRMLAVDITFKDADGKEIEPVNPVSVKMQSDLIKEEEEPVVVHVDDKGEGSLIEDVKEGSKEDEMIFRTDAFSRVRTRRN